MSLDLKDIKTVIFCGGMGTRLREMTEFIPKPMLQIGNRPILWHIMKTYDYYGSRNFILCLGYKGEEIKKYFLNYYHMAYDFTSNLKTREVSFHDKGIEDWTIRFANTGLETLTGERLARVRKHLECDKKFMVTYGDGVSDIDIRKLMEFHNKHGKIATITGGHGHHKYGLLKFDTKTFHVTSFEQKPRLPEHINIGFMVFEREIFDFLSPNRSIEDAFNSLVEAGELLMYPHEGFFHSMDTYKDYQDLNAIWASENVPWKVWESESTSYRG